ncbi:MAG: reverse transcriptase domain-containing protein [Sedimenticola sp.]
MDLDFDPTSILHECRHNPTWTTMGGETPTLPVSVTAEAVLKDNIAFDVNVLPVRDPNVFVAGQLHTCSSEWSKILISNSDHTSATVGSWISHGINVHDFFAHFKGNFKGKAYDCDMPPKQYFPNSNMCKDHVDFIMGQICENIRSGAVSILGNVGTCTPPKVIMPLTVEASKPRLCHDERYINLWTKNCPFRLETLKDVHRLIDTGSVMITCDDKSGYSHIQLTDDSRTYFGFQFGGWLFSYNVLPFGWKASAYIYQTTGMQVTSYLRSYGMLTTQYIDDRMAVSSDVNACTTGCNNDVRSLYSFSPQKLVYVILEILSRLGYTLALKKCQLQPSTRVRFLGFIIDSIRKAYILPADKKDAFITLRDSILSVPYIDVRTLQRFAGKCVSMTLAIPAAQLYSREVNSAISFCLGNSRDIKVEGKLRAEIEYWRFLDGWTDCVPWRKEFHKQFFLVTDASAYKYGAVVLSGEMKGVEFGDFWQTDDARPIHLKEAAAVLCSLQSLEHQVRNHRVDIWTDNTAVIHAWHNQGSRDTNLNSIMKDLFQFTYKHNLDLHLKYIASADNPADKPSRSISLADCMLHTSTWLQIQDMFGPHSIDIMATDTNAMNSHLGTPLRHFTPAPSPGTSGVNVFAQRISNEDNPYVFPPFNLITPLIRLLQEQSVQACTLVAPVMTPKPVWWPLLQSHSSASVKIGRRGETGVILIPTKRGYIPDKVGLKYDLQAFRVHFP